MIINSLHEDPLNSAINLMPDSSRLAAFILFSYACLFAYNLLTGKIGEDEPACN